MELNEGGSDFRKSFEKTVGHEYSAEDMLQPRETDIPALFLVFVVLPLVAYILLGKWSETSKKKERIGLLAHQAAEEAIRVETMAPASVFSLLPLPNKAAHNCAKCFGPAGTRCSRCKSVWYWYDPISILMHSSVYRMIELENSFLSC
ncbi:hypothetical protein M9H77_21541 [Catharanthus roseus]|uniref:Uncharacterized protein n=1 Tax=Catharanthus roseus TaxID=4058 RepID=A0ACC0AMN2_CATRO|nr:hypothetical protein M9H77_21541 [Catharanthus roseus]